MAIQIEILNKTVTTKPTAKGSYQILELAYKNKTFQDKVEGRKIMSFGATAESFKVLAAGNNGEVFDIEVVKNDKGFNDWVKANRAGANTGATAAVSRPANAAAGASSAPRSNFETPEERAQRQVLIVRQSSVSTAAAVLSAGAKSAPKIADVIEAAKEIESYVFGQAAAQADPTDGDVIELPTDDIPF